ncbi:Hypothetical predicted protein [Paramuricea clavata]|uniref:Uncharacterized protein n=1 Tax=Paramuricea clavata TaxID=317549 RepID=A0A7D9DC62_PARCT|nr:Hypothetical predicted protein [Paramuricea clavata]
MAARCGRKWKSLVQRSSSSMQALLDQTAKNRQLPRGISLQVLDERHNLNQIRDFLARAFIANNEPIVHVLGELYYPAVSLNLRIPLIEERFKSLFSEKSMLNKVEQGLSFVAVKDNNPSKLVSVMFAEKYTGRIYKGESTLDDPLCRTGLNLMRTVHEKAEPILEEYSATRRIVFVSHAATHPKYRSLGIIEHTCDTLRARHVDERAALCCLMTSHRLAQFLIQRYGMEVIAEVFYKDYQDNGHKVFEKLSEEEISAKALILCL